MSEITLMHEDIYIYIDSINNYPQYVEGTGTLSIANDSTGIKADYGKMDITVISGTMNGLLLSCNGKEISFDCSLTAGGTMMISLEDNYYTVNGVKKLSGDRIELSDNKINSMKLTITGDAKIQVEYFHNRSVNNSGDLMFCESFSVKSDFDRTEYVNIHGQKRYSVNEKRTHTWDINGIWNSEEFEKFNAGSFSIRLVDIDGGLLELLTDCKVKSINKSSSDMSDYVYQISGTCEEIFN